MIDKQQYERALARAKADGIRILGESAIDGNRSWVIENPAHDGVYVVRLAAGAHELTCNCPARVLCKHRALVHEALEREARSYSEPERRLTVGQLYQSRMLALSQPGIWQ